MATPKPPNLSPLQSTAPPAPPLTRPPAPLGLVLAITFLGSFDTAIINNGLVFIADQGLGYGPRQNLWLMLVLGASYIPSALFCGPILKRARLRHRWLTSRRLLLAIMGSLTLIAQIPLLINQLAPQWTEPALWLMGIAFMAITGTLWPIIEAYLSGGRRAKQLRGALGKFNICWSTALVAAYWMMAPLLEFNPFLILSLLGAAHLLIGALVWRLPDEPTQEIRNQSHSQTHQHDPCPASYSKFLTIFRVLLIASYIILSVMIPMLPNIEHRLGVPALLLTPIASCWLVVRVGLFAIFERWHGWHGHWWTPWIGMATMISGFAIAMASPLFGTPNPGTMNLTGVLVLIGGLSFAGIGIASIYCGALYYAMALGANNEGIESGGKHEAMIGLGYTIGPICGLAGGMLAFEGQGHGGIQTINQTGVIVVTSVVVLAMVFFAFLKTKTKV